MNLSLAITTFNRFDLTIESFAQVIDDPRIDDIVVLDDASTDGSYEKLCKYYRNIPKIRVLRQAQNRGMSMNKRDAIGYAKNEWVIIFDSDNIIGTDYLNAFYNYLGNGTPIEQNIFCPDFAKPDFDYTKYSNNGTGGKYTAKEASSLINQDSFNCLMNTCNYIVHREKYLKTYQYNPTHVASDTVWHNYNHLKSGGNFHIVPGMHYYHRIHKGSGFLQGVDHNMRMQAQVRKMIMELK